MLRNTVNSFVPASLSDKEAFIGRAFGGPRRCHRRAWRPLALPSASSGQQLVFWSLLATQEEVEELVGPGACAFVGVGPGADHCPPHHPQP